MGFLGFYLGPSIWFLGKMNLHLQISKFPGFSKFLVIAQLWQPLETEMEDAGLQMRLLQPTDDCDPTVRCVGPSPTRSAFPICVQSTPRAEGTAGFSLDEGRDSNRLFLVALATSSSTAQTINPTGLTLRLAFIV